MEKTFNLSDISLSLNWMNKTHPVAV